MNERTALRAETPAASLDEAWAEAEDAMPYGWHVGEVKNTDYRGDGQRWIVMAWEFGADPDYLTFKHAYADTPADALRALAARLRAEGSESADSVPTLAAHPLDRTAEENPK